MPRLRSQESTDHKNKRRLEARRALRAAEELALDMAVEFLASKVKLEELKEAVEKYQDVRRAAEQ